MITVAVYLVYNRLNRFVVGGGYIRAYARTWYVDALRHSGCDSQYQERSGGYSKEGREGEEIGEGPGEETFPTKGEDAEEAVVYVLCCYVGYAWSPGHT